jgi:glucokinase
MSPHAIGVDIGGTNTKLALVDESGVVHARESFPTPRDPSPDRLVEGIIAGANAFRARVEAEGFRVEGMGFTVPHFFDGPDWTQRQTNNIPSLEGYPLYPPLRRAFGSSIAMMNDLSAAGIAEYAYGRGRDKDRMLLMAIGTGIAISVVTRNEGLIHFSWDTTGDTGQIIVDPFGQAECSCGGRGCLEAVAAAPALRRRGLSEIARGRTTLLARIREERGDLEARDISEAAAAGDAVARDILDQAGFFLGVALTSYLHIFRPTLMVLAGGVAQAGDLLLEPIRRTMSRLASPWYLSRLEGIVVSALGNDGQAIGCASLILYPGRFIR